MFKQVLLNTILFICSISVTSNAVEKFEKVYTFYGKVLCTDFLYLGKMQRALVEVNDDTNCNLPNEIIVCANLHKQSLIDTFKIGVEYVITIVPDYEFRDPKNIVDYKSFIEEDCQYIVVDVKEIKSKNSE